MASKTVPADDFDAIRRDLQDCDAVTRSYVEQIDALCGAAQARLALDADALGDVHVLLDTIKNLALDIENEIISAAEKHGCSCVSLPSPSSRFVAQPKEASHG